MEKNRIPCAHISVHCVTNDPVRVHCGEPQFLGFDFNVREEEEEEAKNIILMALESNEVPFLNFHVGKEEAVESALWSSERIVKEIADDAEYLKEEADRVYFHKYSMMK